MQSAYRIQLNIGLSKLLSAFPCFGVHFSWTLVGRRMTKICVLMLLAELPCGLIFGPKLGQEALAFWVCFCWKAKLSVETYQITIPPSTPPNLSDHKSISVGAETVVIFLVLYPVKFFVHTSNCGEKKPQNSEVVIFFI